MKSCLPLFIFTRLSGCSTRMELLTVTGNTNSYETRLSADQQNVVGSLLSRLQ
jgi:uncharacterized protein YceK